MMDEEGIKEPDHILENLKLISHVLETGEASIIIHPLLGEIVIDKGIFSEKGYGINHIIYQRFIKNKKDETYIAAILPLILESIQHGKYHLVEEIKNNKKNFKYFFEKNDIVAIVTRTWFGRKEQWLLTGYQKNKKEATDAIQSVIEQYSYTPAFSDFRKQVGAVASQLNIANNEPNGKEKTMKKPKRNAPSIPNCYTLTKILGVKHEYNFFKKNYRSRSSKIPNKRKIRRSLISFP